MKRDLDLVRKLVLAVEDRSPGASANSIVIDGYTDEQIGYHNYLLVDSGLAEGLDATSINDSHPNWLILHLTSAGHDFADASRNESTWRAATTIVKDKAGGVTLDIMKQVLIGVVKNTLGI